MVDVFGFSNMIYRIMACRLPMFSYRLDWHHSSNERASTARIVDAVICYRTYTRDITHSGFLSRPAESLVTRVRFFCAISRWDNSRARRRGRELKLSCARRMYVILRLDSPDFWFSFVRWDFWTSNSAQMATMQLSVYSPCTSMQPICLRIGLALIWHM